MSMERIKQNRAIAWLTAILLAVAALVMLIPNSAPANAFGTRSTSAEPSATPENLPWDGETVIYLPGLIDEYIKSPDDGQNSAGNPSKVDGITGFNRVDEVTAFAMTGTEGPGPTGANYTTCSGHCTMPMTFAEYVVCCLSHDHQRYGQPAGDPTHADPEDPTHWSRWANPNKELIANVYAEIIQLTYDTAPASGYGAWGSVMLMEGYEKQHSYATMASSNNAVWGLGNWRRWCTAAPSQGDASLFPPYGNQIALSNSFSPTTTYYIIAITWDVWEAPATPTPLPPTPDLSTPTPVIVPTPTAITGGDTPTPVGTPDNTTPIPTNDPSISKVIGDATMDFAVNIFDILEVRDHIFTLPGKTLTGQAFINADVAKDFGVLNIYDILGIRDIIFKTFDYDKLAADKAAA